MKFAVLLAKDMPSNRRGLPDEWPVQAIPFEDGDSVVHSKAIVMSLEELEDWKVKYRSLYDDWRVKLKTFNKKMNAVWKPRNECKRAWAESGWEDDDLKNKFETLHREVMQHGSKWVDDRCCPTQIVAKVNKQIDDNH